jgi:preprotein translocase subunit SecY
MGIKRQSTNVPASPLARTPRAKAPVPPARSSNPALIDSLTIAWGIPELRRRIIFVFAMFAVYIVGLHIPIPNINHDALAIAFKSGGNILGMVDVFTGGALKNFTIFALGILPYINSSIIMNLMTFALPHLHELAKEGESGRKEIAKYTRYLTMGLALVQSLGVTIFLARQHVLLGGWADAAGVMIIMIAGTCFLMWVGEEITDKGIGNGISLIIFCGIMVRLPTQIGQVGELYKSGTVQLWQILILVVAFFATVIGIVFMTLGERKVPIQHVRKVVGNKMSQGGTSYLPFRVASAGVIPIIFALSFTLLPATIAQLFFKPNTPSGLEAAKVAGWFNPGTSPWTAIGYALIIIFFTYFYTMVQVNVEDMADNLKKYGSYVPGIRPGKATMDYLNRVVTRITLAGALFLAVIALMQYWIPSITNTGRAFTLVGGTSMLIVVQVALDTMRAIEAQLLMRNYEGFIK